MIDTIHVHHTGWGVIFNHILSIAVSASPDYDIIVTGVPNTVRLGQTIQPTCSVNTTKPVGHFQFGIRFETSTQRKPVVHDNRDGTFTLSSSVNLK